MMNTIKVGLVVLIFAAGALDMIKELVWHVSLDRA